MKKIIALLLMLTMLVACFASCGGGKIGIVMDPECGRDEIGNGAVVFNDENFHIIHLDHLL